MIERTGIFLETTIKTPTFVDVTPMLPPTPEPVDPEFGASFEEIWEQDGRWFMGPAILSNIIDQCKEKSIFIKPSINRSGAIVCLPILETYINLVPEELLIILSERIFKILENRKSDIEKLNIIIGLQITQSTINQGNSILWGE
jgi:hypothetical protein